MNTWLFAALVALGYMIFFIFASRAKAKQKTEKDYKAKYGTRKPPPE